MSGTITWSSSLIYSRVKNRSSDAQVVLLHHAEKWQSSRKRCGHRKGMAGGVGIPPLRHYPCWSNASLFYATFCLTWPPLNRYTFWGISLWPLCCFTKLNILPLFLLNSRFSFIQGFTLFYLLALPPCCYNYVFISDAYMWVSSQLSSVKCGCRRLGLLLYFFHEPLPFG